MKRKKINSHLQTRIREYLHFIWKEEKSQNMEEEEKIIKSLSHSLIDELNLESYGFFLKNSPIFPQFFSDKTLKKLVSVMKEIFLTPEDAIFIVLCLLYFLFNFQNSKINKKATQQYILLAKAL